MFFLRHATSVAVISAAVGFIACSSPGSPSTSLAAARPTSPSSGASLSYYSQPIQIAVSGGVATGGAQVLTIVEVATDNAFADIVKTQTPSADARGQLVLMLDHLQAATTYYWRVKTTAGNNPGTVSPTATFTVGPLLALQPPVPVQPLADTFPHKRPTFAVSDSARNIPAAVSYHVDVALDAAFTEIVASGTTAEAPTQTLLTLPTDLVPGKTYYWRAQASDTAKGVTSAYSPTQSFTIVNPDDGSYAYTLQVQWPSVCLTRATASGCVPGGGNPFGWAQASSFAFDGTLVVAGDAVKLTVPNQTLFGPVRLTLQRTGTRLTGSVSGSAPGSGGFTQGPFSIAQVILEGNVSGNADDQGRFAGTYDGNMGLWKFGFPCDATVTCATSGFAWTLKPK
jgi:hypothetical protein